MCCRHRGGCPESDKKSKIQWVTYIPVKHRRSELKMGIRFSYKVQPYLPEAKQIEMINQEGADQNYSETQQTNGLDNNTSCFGLYLPNDTTQRLPIPKEQEQAQTGKQDIRASFYWSRHKLRPPFFECRTCHDAVLKGE